MAGAGRRFAAPPPDWIRQSRLVTVIGVEAAAGRLDRDGNHFITSFMDLHLQLIETTARQIRLPAARHTETRELVTAVDFINQLIITTKLPSSRAFTDTTTTTSPIPQLKTAQCFRFHVC